jgi:hypothetical protein
LKNLENGCCCTKNKKTDPLAGKESEMDELVQKCIEKLPSPENITANKLLARPKFLLIKL